MLLWIGIAALTAAAVLALLRPILADSAPASATIVESGAVYRDQLTEIDAERDRGLIGPTEAEAARVEIARRLLATTELSGGKAAPSSSRDLRTIAISIAASLPALAVALYLLIGAPDRPGQPYALQVVKGEEQRADQLVRRVEERLRTSPEDGNGWDTIAPVYMQLGRYNEAAAAFERALRLIGESPDRLAGLAEAHVLANDGIVTQVARKYFERLRALSPTRPESRFWLGVADEQDGRMEQAATAYAQLLKDSSDDVPWRATVAERLRSVRAKLGRTSETAADSGATSVGKAPALPQESVRTSEEMSEEARDRMIEDMVAGLDKRLRSDGRSLDGWQRLIRAYTVLDRREDALSALERARTALASEPQALDALGTLARSLGLAS